MQWIVSLDTNYEFAFKDAISPILKKNIKNHNFKLVSDYIPGLFWTPNIKMAKYNWNSATYLNLKTVRNHPTLQISVAASQGLFPEVKTPITLDSGYLIYLNIYFTNNEK